MSLIKWNNNSFFPEFSNLFGKFFDDEWSTSMQRMSTVPSVNISENEKNFALELAAPGLEKEDFKLDLSGNVLKISAEKQTENNTETSDETTKAKHTYREFSYTSFERSFKLPESVKQEAIQASYKDGVLNITFPKKEEATVQTPRKIVIS